MRHLAVVLAAALVFTMIAPAFAQPFSDVPTNHWAYDAIAELAAKGLVEGYPDGTFRGDRTVTRYEMAMIVARLLARVESIQIPAPQAPQVTRTDVASIQRLVNEFRAELAALGVRVTALEEELNAIKAKMDNVRITGAVRFRYNINRKPPSSSLSALVNGNPQVFSVDASNSPYLTQAYQEEDLAFDGSVAPNVHFVLTLISANADGHTNFNSSQFGVGSGWQIASLDNAFFDWKNAWGWPIEIKLGRQGCTGILRCDGVVFGPFGLVMDTTDNTWTDSTNDSGANAADGLWVGGHHPAILDLQWQAAIIRVNGASNYASGEDAYGFDANIEIMPGLRVGGAYVANSIYENSPAANFQPAALSGVAGISDPNKWHLYGPGTGTPLAKSPNCITVGSGSTGGFACPAQGYGYAGYIQWDILSGIHLDGEYAGWTDSVLGGTDTGYQANVHLDLGTMTGIGHNVGLDLGYLYYGQNFYPPYGNTEADEGMLGHMTGGNIQGFRGGVNYDITSAWGLYGKIYSGNSVGGLGAGQPMSEYEAGVVYKFAPNAKITFKIREQRVNNIEQFQLYRTQFDYKF